MDYYSNPLASDPKFEDIGPCAEAPWIPDIKIGVTGYFGVVWFFFCGGMMAMLRATNQLLSFKALNISFG